MPQDKKKIIQIVGDVEMSGQVAGIYDAISMGFVVLEPGLSRKFYCEMAPLHDAYQDGAYKVVGITREQHCAMPPPHLGMLDLFRWIASLGGDRCVYWSDNNGFDFACLNWYIWWMIGDHGRTDVPQDTRQEAYDILGITAADPQSPFGHTSRRINDVYAGFSGNVLNTAGWKKHRQTQHTHRADDDAQGNAEALLYLMDRYEQKALW